MVLPNSLSTGPSLRRKGCASVVLAGWNHRNGVAKNPMISNLCAGDPGVNAADWCSLVDSCGKARRSLISQAAVTAGEVGASILIRHELEKKTTLARTGASGSTHRRRGASLAGYQPGIGILLPRGFASSGAAARYHASGGRPVCFPGGASLPNSLIRTVLAEMNIVLLQKGHRDYFAKRRHVWEAASS